MPRDGSDVYHRPFPDVVPDTSIESTVYNGFVADVELEMNTPRPISAGGTGTDNIDDVLNSIGGEKASQLVSNFDSHVWIPGSFRALASASGGPITGHAFAGWVYSQDAPASPPTNLNVIVQARDQSDIMVPGRLYVREKRAGIWGTWGLDGNGLASPSPPVGAPDNTLWWDAETGTLYIYYNDGNTKQWVIASPQPDVTQFLQKDGDTMTGTLGLVAHPTEDLHAASKLYVDNIREALPPPFEAGVKLLFPMMAAPPVGWTIDTTHNDKALRVVSGSPVGGGIVPFSTVFNQATTAGHALNSAQQASMAVTGSMSGTATGPSGEPLVFRSDGAPSIGWTAGSGSAGLNQSGGAVSGSINGVATGGGTAHAHDINMKVAYVDAIIATKDA